MTWTALKFLHICFKMNRMLHINHRITSSVFFPIVFNIRTSGTGGRKKKSGLSDVFYCQMVGLFRSWVREQLVKFSLWVNSMYPLEKLNSDKLAVVPSKPFLSFFFSSMFVLKCFFDFFNVSNSYTEKNYY